MKKIFISLAATLLAWGASGEALSNGPVNGNGNGDAYTCNVYDGTKSVQIAMVFVKGGTLSGTSITVGDFYIGKYEVTQKQWLDVMGFSLQDMWTTAGISGSPTRGVGDNYPMYFVSWTEAKAFITALNAMNGGGNKFRLPTEAEWEYAARGGNPQKSYEYAGSNTVGDVAWYPNNSDNTTHPTTDLKLPNGIGAYNMSGNVWEWCEDWYVSGGVVATPPATPSATGSYRVTRGGSWDYGPSHCAVSHRSYYAPDAPYYGFRLAYSSNP
jgi:formylglycine-generating enzyme required for sulfatase activity